MLTLDALFVLWILAGVGAFAYAIKTDHRGDLARTAHQIHDTFGPFGAYAVMAWALLAVLVTPPLMVMDWTERSYRWVSMMWAFWRVERLKRRLCGVVRPPDDLESVSTMKGNDHDA